MHSQRLAHIYLLGCWELVAAPGAGMYFQGGAPVRRLFAFDLDGTISGSNRSLSTQVARSVEAIHQANDLVLFITGRRQIDMAPMRDHMMLPDYFGLNNGAYVYRVRDGHELLHLRVIPRDTRVLVGESLAAGIVLDVVTEDDWLTNVLTAGDVEYGHKIGRMPRVFSTVDEIPLGEVEAFMVAGFVDELREIIDRRGLELRCVESEPRCADIMNSQASKWDCIEHICRAEGIAPDMVVSVGNYTNDIEMIKNAGLGVAVADALPGVREAADVVLVSTCEEDPVAEIAAYVRALDTC